MPGTTPIVTLTCKLVCYHGVCLLKRNSTLSDIPSDLSEKLVNSVTLALYEVRLIVNIFVVFTRLLLLDFLFSVEELRF